MITDFLPFTHYCVLYTVGYLGDIHFCMYFSMLVCCMLCVLLTWCLHFLCFRLMLFLLTCVVDCCVINLLCMTMKCVLLAKTVICRSSEVHRWWYVGCCAQDDLDYDDGEDDHIGRDEESSLHDLLQYDTSHLRSPFAPFACCVFTHCKLCHSPLSLCLNPRTLFCLRPPCFCIAPTPQYC